MVGASLAFTAHSALLASGARKARLARVVECESGKLRGFERGGVACFRGVPYAADTGGVNRFMAPRPVVKWAGLRDAIQFGARAPQNLRNVQPQADSGAPRYGEDCCVLNVYAPRASVQSAMPVMVFVHGGGFRSGAGDAPVMDGVALASFGKVVVVTVNRRLNVLGFANLGHLDPDFVDAANVGQLDLIAALRWVQANIGAFGGDPGRVMLFGHSGGGSAVETLSIMPGAAGLFRASANLSGTSAFTMNTSEQLIPATELFLRNLGLGRGDLRKIQHIAPDALLAAHDAAFRSLGRGDYRPTVDLRHIPDAPLTLAALERTAHLPTIMNSTATEASAWLVQDRRNLAVSRDQVLRRIGDQFGIGGAAAGAAFDAYREQNHSRSPWEILLAVASDSLVRMPMRRAADARSAAAKAPVYVSEFAWMSPKDGGIWGSPHGVEIAFAFGNPGRSDLSAGQDPAIAATSRNLMSALIAMARTGSPANRTAPNWPPHDPHRRPTMVIARQCELIEDYRKADRTASELLPSQDAFSLISGPLFRHVP